MPKIDRYIYIYIYNVINKPMALAQIDKMLNINFNFFWLGENDKKKFIQLGMNMSLVIPRKMK